MKNVYKYLSEKPAAEATRNDLIALCKNTHGVVYAHLPYYGYKSLLDEEMEAIQDGSFFVGLYELSKKEYEKIVKKI